MSFAISETNRRRAKQVAYNEAHGIEPVSIVKAVRDLTDQLGGKAQAEARGERPINPVQMPKGRAQAPDHRARDPDEAGCQGS